MTVTRTQKSDHNHRHNHNRTMTVTRTQKSAAIKIQSAGRGFLARRCRRNTAALLINLALPEDATRDINNAELLDFLSRYPQHRGGMGRMEIAAVTIQRAWAVHQDPSLMLDLPSPPTTTNYLMDTSDDEEQQSSEPIPKSFVCPITHDVMHDPVVDREGYSYDRVAIMIWLRTNATSPITRNPLSADQLTANRALRNAIEEYHTNAGLVLSGSQMCDALHVRHDEAADEAESWQGMSVTERRAFLATLFHGYDDTLEISTLAEAGTMYGRLRYNDEEVVQADGGVDPDWTDGDGFVRWAEVQYDIPDDDMEGFLEDAGFATFAQLQEWMATTQSAAAAAAAAAEDEFITWYLDQLDEEFYEFDEDQLGQHMIYQQRLMEEEMVARSHEYAQAHSGVGFPSIEDGCHADVGVLFELLEEYLPFGLRLPREIARLPA